MHIWFLDEHRAGGAMLAVGPFRDQVDENLRRLCVYALPVEQAQRSAATDPLVVAGCLVAGVFTWLTAPGQVRFGPH